MRIPKQVVFNDKKSIDREMLTYIGTKKFSTYVKELILKDMAQETQNPNPVINKESIKDILKELLQEIDNDKETVNENINSDIVQSELIYDESEDPEAENITLDGIKALTF